MGISDAQILKSREITRVECPACAQRTWLEDDCHCCGGVAWVNVLSVQRVIFETLFDCVRYDRPAPDWILVGTYEIESPARVMDTFVVLDDRTVHLCTEQADRVWLEARNQPKWNIWDRILSAIFGGLRGAA